MGFIAEICAEQYGISRRDQVCLSRISIINKIKTSTSNDYNDDNNGDNGDDDDDGDMHDGAVIYIRMTIVYKATIVRSMRLIIINSKMKSYLFRFQTHLHYVKMKILSRFPLSLTSLSFLVVELMVILILLIK